MFRHFRNSLAAICLIAAAVAVMLVPAPAAAQILYGSLTGTVTDQQKAAMPGVTVTAINTGTTVATEAVTDDTGNYTIRNLPPGIYDVTAVLQGFRELRQRGMNITAGNIIRADLVLQLGQLSETVNVVAESTLLQTERADLNTELSAKAVTNLPLNWFRNYQTLLNLVPGATPTQFQNAEIDTPARSLRTWVNGTQPNANTTRVDGAVSVNVWLPHHAMYVQSAESIDTVNIATNNFDADTGMAAGAAQTVITKSGTNQLRGSAFLFLNTDGMNTNTFFNDYNGLPKPAVNTKTYGGTVGGPIMKNKLFYFFSWERYDTKRPTTYTYTVPTAKMRAGDFSEVAAAYPAFKLFNPFSDRTGAAREQWTNNIVPAQYLSAITQTAMSKFFPAVNSARDLNSNLLLDDYTQLREEYQKRDNVDVKVNWQIKPTAMVWGKFGYMNNTGSGNNFYLGFDNPSIGDTRVILTTFGTTWTLGPSTVLDGNFGMSRQDQTVLPADYGTNYGMQLGIPGTNNANDIRESGLPVMASTYTLEQRVGKLDAAVAQGNQLLRHRRLDEGLLQARDAHGHGLRAAGTQPRPGGVGRLRPQGRLLVQRQHDRRGGLHIAGMEQLRRDADGPPELLRGRHPDRDDDRPREPVRVLRARPVERVSQTDGERGCPPPLLPAHDPRRKGHRDPQLQHLRRHAGRHRRPAEGCRRQSAEVVPRAAPRCGVSPQREHRVQSGLRPVRETRCRGRARCADRTRSTSTTTPPRPAPTTT